MSFLPNGKVYYLSLLILGWKYFHLSITSIKQFAKVRFPIELALAVEFESCFTPQVFLQT